MLPRPTPDPVKPGQESVWAFPRPPALRRCTDPIQVFLGGQLICDTRESWQVLETSHPPTYYLPIAAFVDGALAPAPGRSLCEWKGQAAYLDVTGGGRTERAVAWYYPSPTPAFTVLRDHLALYAARMERCVVAGEEVVPQPGGFYGGWVTSRYAGPFKGIPGSNFW